MNEKVSIIIPAYRCENTIERCVESIINGNYKNIEVILIDDCSPDCTLDVCRKLESEDNRIIVLHNEVNSGVSFTRNQGLRHMTGTYLMFVDSDDWVEPDYVETLVSAIEDGDNVIAMSGYVNHDEVFNNRTDNFGWTNFDSTLQCSLSEIFLELYNGRLFQQLWNKIFITKFVKENNVRFDESISLGEDFRFILDYLKLFHNHKCVLVNKGLYHYIRSNTESLMFKVGYESVEEPLKNLRSMYEIMGMKEDAIEEKLLTDREKMIESYSYLIMHNAGMNSKEKKKLILNLDKNKGTILYKKNKNLLIKEKLLNLLRK